MIALAGHGKDPRLVQAELPIVPNVGDRIREDANYGNYRLDCLVREGTFCKAQTVRGLTEKTTWLVELDTGKQIFFDPSICEIIERVAAPVLVEVVSPEIVLPFDYEISDKEKGNENYTPSYFFEPCRDFLGGFDLDPFSNAIAQKSIQALTFWTKADNALSQDWTPYKKKWVNPPYSANVIKLAIAKTLEHSHIGETLLLVNTSSSAKWFQACMEKCSAYLHPSKRIAFYNPYREIEYQKKTKKRTGNEYDQTLFYFGNRPLEFAEALASLGNAVQPIRKSVLAENNPIENSLPEQEDFAVSISGEAIIYDPNAKPIEIKSGDRIKITENRELYDLLTPICNWYSGRELATFAVNALGHALAYAREGKISEAVALLTPNVLQEVKKPHTNVAELKKFLKNLPSIDADKSLDLEIAITTEPKLAVAKLRMDEPTKVSVLVEFPKTELEILRDRLADLQKEANSLEQQGASPKGVWLEKSRPSKKNFDQVCWKSGKPHKWLDDKKSRYIGKVDHDEHKSAITQFKAGKRLQEIEKEMQKIEKQLRRINHANE